LDAVGRQVNDRVSTMPSKEVMGQGHVRVIVDRLRGPPMIGKNKKGPAQQGR
jgi:hypothetical protein